MFMGSDNIKFDIHISTTYRNARVNQWADSHLHKRSEVRCVWKHRGLRRA